MESVEIALQIFSEHFESSDMTYEDARFSTFVTVDNIIAVLEQYEIDVTLWYNVKRAIHKL